MDDYASQLYNELRINHIVEKEVVALQQKC